METSATVLGEAEVVDSTGATVAGVVVEDLTGAAVVGVVSTGAAVVGVVVSTGAAEVEIGQ